MLSIGSASQLAVIKPATKQHMLSPQSVMEVPYFSGNNILAACALAGGNVIATFVSMLQEWLGKLGVQRSEVEVRQMLIAAAEDKMDTTLQVDPTLWGERHRPDIRGTVQNIGIDNLTLGDISSATLRGIVANLRRMMPIEIFQELNVRIAPTGHAAIYIHLTRTSHRYTYTCTHPHTHKHIYTHTDPENHWQRQFFAAEFCTPAAH